MTISKHTAILTGIGLLLLGCTIGVAITFFWAGKNTKAVLRVLVVPQALESIKHAELLRNDDSKTVLEDKEKSLPLIANWFRSFEYNSESDIRLLHRIKDYRDKWNLQMPEEINDFLNKLPPTKQQKQLAKYSENIGKTLPIMFTALDGQSIDLSQLKGKVVLIDFWATWCGPCVGEVPKVTAAYEKFHSQGFEVIGISFDKDRARLEQFIKENGMPWPQYFDGKGWENEFGKKYGITSIPTMWLVGKDGKLADVNASDGLDLKIEKLIGTTPIP